METNKEKFVRTMNKVRIEEVGMLKDKIDRAKQNDEKTINIGLHDASWILTALVHHWDSEKGFKGITEDK